MPLTLGLLLVLAQAPVAPARPDTVTLVVVATTDLHGHAYHWDYVRDREAPWGLTRAATVIDSLRRAHPGRVVVVDAGDIIQGDPFAAYVATVRPLEPHPVTDAMSAAGYDAAVVGNHEFDFGLDVLARAERGATFPLLGANVFALPRDTVLFRPFVVLPRDGLRVAVAGFTTPGVALWNRRHLAERVRVRPIADVAAATLAAMAGSNAAVRIVLIHSGMDGPSSYPDADIGPENVAALLAALPVRPHLVVVGHSHRTMADSVLGGVHFVQPPPWARGLAIAHVRIERQGGATRVLSVRTETVPLDRVPPDPAVTRRLAETHALVRTWIEAPVAQTGERWSLAAARAEDTPALDFINEVQRRATGADLASAAAFDPAVAFGPGPVRRRDVAGLYPYENTLMAVRIDGATLRAYLERSAAYFGRFGSGEPPVDPRIPGYDYDVVHGVDYAIDLARPLGERIVQLTYRGRLVTPADTFTLALNSYRQAGGGGFTMLRGLPVTYDRGESVRDVLLAAAEAAGTLRHEDWFTPSWRLLPPEARQAVRGRFPREAPATPADDTTRVAPPPPRPAPEPAVPLAEAAPVVARLRFAVAPAVSDESALANLVADAVRNAGRAPLGLLPRRLLRGGLPGGDVRLADVQGAVEDAVLAQGQVTGADLLAAIEAGLADSVPALAISGMVVRWDPARPAGSRVREVRLPGDRRVERDGRYHVAAPAGLLPGLAPIAERLAQAVAEYLPRLPQPVDPPTAGRWERRP